MTPAKRGSTAPARAPGNCGSERPRILFVSPYWPHRATCASELRSFHVARALKEIGEVDVAVVGGEGREREWEDQPHHEYRIASFSELHPRPNDTIAKKIRWMFDPRAEYPHGSGVDREAMEHIVRTAKDYDIVWFSKLRTPNMFPGWAWQRSVADIDDVPSTYERSVLRNSDRLGERLAAARRFFSLRRRDRILGERFDVLGVCSELDRRYLESLGVSAPIHVIPNGFDLPAKELPRRPANPPRIGFIGIFDYGPNLEGIRWFAKHCWPHVKREVPEARLRLVGRESDGPLKPDGVDIDGLGFVEAADEEIATWSAMIVPIRTGAGTRGKIAQAFSLKCPVVSTSLGAYGYEPADGREMRVADDPENFTKACVRAIQRPEEAAAMAQRARQQFLEKWTWDAIRPRIWAAAEDCLRLSGRGLERKVRST